MTSKPLIGIKKRQNRITASAQNNLGVMYYRGRGLPQDYKKARKWLKLAASQVLPRQNFS